MATNLLTGRIGNLREAFDRDATFECVRDFRCNGKDFKCGDEFNVSLVETRRLRLMYEQRLLKIVPSKPKPPPIPAKPDFTGLSDDGVRQWLKNNGKLLRPRMSRDKLMALVDTTWDELVAKLKADHEAAQAKPKPPRLDIQPDLTGVNLSGGKPNGVAAAE